jgi:hypothetical protein
MAACLFSGTLYLDGVCACSCTLLSHGFCVTLWHTLLRRPIVLLLHLDVTAFVYLFFFIFSPICSSNLYPGLKLSMVELLASADSYWERITGWWQGLSHDAALLACILAFFIDGGWFLFCLELTGHWNGCIVFCLEFTGHWVGWAA